MFWRENCFGLNFWEWSGTFSEIAIFLSPMHDQAFKLAEVSWIEGL